MMKQQLQTFFSENYNQRYYNLLWVQFVLLLGYIVFSLISTTKNITGLPFFTPNQILIAFSLLELVVSILFIVKIPKDVPKQNLFLVLMVLNIFFLVLYVEQFILPNNPLQYYPDDLLFVSFQFLLILVLLLVFKENNVYQEASIFTVILVASFFMLFLSKLPISFAGLEITGLLVATVVFWIFLWFIIGKFTLRLYKNNLWKAVVPLLVGPLMAIGMFMGMMQKLGTELGKTVFNTINYQAFSLQSANTQISGFNPEIAMIIINLITGYCLLFVLLSALIFIKDVRKESMLLLTIGLTGLATLPLLGLIRFFALFKYVSIDKNKNLAKSDFDDNNS